MNFYILALSALLGFAQAQGPPPAPNKNYQYTTPVPILKQIDTHNDDGSYSYGYENADGTYKIETKYATGEVYGKYGYIDDTGILREVEYGASKNGFAPTGNEIKVPPPTINANPDVRPLGPEEEDDGQYREDPSIYYKNDPNNIDPPQSQYPGIQFNQNTYAPSFPMPQTYQPAPVYKPTPQPYTPPTPQPSYNNYWNPAPVQPQYNNWNTNNNWNQNNNWNRNNWNPSPPGHPGYNIFAGHPASNIDIWTGSYTVQYR